MRCLAAKKPQEPIDAHFIQTPVPVYESISVGPEALGNPFALRAQEAPVFLTALTHSLKSISCNMDSRVPSKIHAGSLSKQLLKETPPRLGPYFLRMALFRLSQRSTRPSAVTQTSCDLAS